MLKEIAFGIIISLLFISLVILFCAVLIKLYIQKIKEHNLKELAFQKTLNSAILETQEQLLTSISQDLHDDAGQQLTVINFQLENLKLDYPDCDKSLSPISESVANLSQSLRQISHSLNNNWLTENGLINAIKAEVDRIKNQKIMVHFKSSDTEQLKFNVDEQIVVFRIFQESINNMLKHAKATSIAIEIKTMPKFELKITDNGIGFNQNTNNRNTLGIENCKQRAKMINHTFSIESQLNQGTTITLLEN
jgi:signal transduction histidine kinase